TYVKDGQEVSATDPDPFASITGGFWSLDEPKADIGSLWLTQQLIQKGLAPATDFQKGSVVLLMAMFQYMNGPSDDTHTHGAWVNLNYLLEKGALTFDPSTTQWSVNDAQMQQAIPDLLRNWIEIERSGDPARAQAFFDQYGKTD